MDNATIAEAGGVATFTATLSAQSGLPVTVDLAFSGTATLTEDYTRSGTQVVIAAGQTSGTVTVTAAQDTLDENSETVVVDIDSVTNGTEQGTQQQTTTITDDDAAPSITLAVNNANIAEADGVATFTVTLSAQSGLNVTVDLAFSGTATGGGTDYNASATQVVITAGNTTGTATVTAVQDTLDENNETVVVDIDSVMNGTENGTQQQTTTITDDDTAAVTVDPTSGLTTTEAGGTATFTVVLDTEPAASVMIALESSDTTEGTASPSSLTFTVADWDHEQTVTVTGIDDSEDDGNIDYTITATVSSSDTDYDSLDPVHVSAANQDNDTAGVTVNPTIGLTTEDGGTATFAVALNTKPTADVTIGLSSSDMTEGTVSPSSVTFTAANWDTAQTVTLTGVNDDLDDGDVAYTAVTAAASSSDTDYHGVNPADVSATNQDNDVRVTVASTQGGTTDPSGLVIVDTNDDMPYTICATPDACWAFVRWEESVPGSVADTGAACTTVTATEDVTVTAHFRSVCYYVNDDSTECDIWCTDIGDAANPGTSPDAPLDSVQGVLDAHNLEPGDTLYIDTGAYDLSAPVLIGAEDSGTEAEPVLLQGVGGQGSCGSSLLRIGSAEAGIRVQGATGIAIRGITCQGDGKAEASGIEVLDSMWISLAQNQLYGNGTAVLAESSGNVLIASNFIYGNRQMGIQVSDSVDVTDVTHNTFDSNHCDLAVVGTCADVSVLYNIFWAAGKGCECFNVDTLSQITFLSNYNDLCASKKAIAGHWGEKACKNLKKWQKESGQDADSIAVVPAVRDAKARQLQDRDYHLTNRSRKLIDQLDDGDWFVPAGALLDIDGDSRLPAPGEEVEVDYGADEYTPDPSIQAPKKLRFKTTRVGERRDEVLMITNKGKGPLAVWSIASDNPVFEVDPDGELVFPEIIDPGGSLEVAVRFEPDEKGKHRGKLIIRSNDRKKPEWKVKLRGKAKE